MPWAPIWYKYGKQQNLKWINEISSLVGNVSSLRKRGEPVKQEFVMETHGTSNIYVSGSH
jgi:hypothetical protein